MTRPNRGAHVTTLVWIPLLMVSVKYSLGIGVTRMLGRTCCGGDDTRLCMGPKMGASRRASIVEYDACRPFVKCLDGSE
jgi:hypothetical protein